MTPINPNSQNPRQPLLRTDDDFRPPINSLQNGQNPRQPLLRTDDDFRPPINSLQNGQNPRQPLLRTDDDFRPPINSLQNGQNPRQPLFRPPTQTCESLKKNEHNKKKKISPEFRASITSSMRKQLTGSTTQNELSDKLELSSSKLLTNIKNGYLRRVSERDYAILQNLVVSSSPSPINLNQTNIGDIKVEQLEKSSLNSFNGYLRRVSKGDYVVLKKLVSSSSPSPVNLNQTNIGDIKVEQLEESSLNSFKGAPDLLSASNLSSKNLNQTNIENINLEQLEESSNNSPKKTIPDDLLSADGLREEGPVAPEKEKDRSNEDFSFPSLEEEEDFLNLFFPSFNE